MEKNYMLTTFDNPFNPFVDFKSWYMFDCEKRHNSSSRLARLVDINNEMTEKEINEEQNRAIDLMLKYDFVGEYFKGTEEDIEDYLKTRKSVEKSENVDENDEKIDENEEKQTATATNA